MTRILFFNELQIYLHIGLDRRFNLLFMRKSTSLTTSKISFGLTHALRGISDVTNFLKNKLAKRLKL